MLHLEAGTHKYFPGDYTYYLEQLEKNAGAPDKSVVLGNKSVVPEPVEGRQKDEISHAPSTSSGTAGQSGTPLSWEEQKKLEAEKRKKEKTLANLEKQLEELEQKKSELEGRLADPAVYSNGEKAKAVQREINDLAAQIEEVTEQWMLASE